MILRGVAVLGAALAALRGRCSVPGFVCPRVRFGAILASLIARGLPPALAPARPAPLRSKAPLRGRPAPGPAWRSWRAFSSGRGCVPVWARAGGAWKPLARAGGRAWADRSRWETVGEEMRMTAPWRPPGAVFDGKGGGFLIHPPKIASTGRKTGRHAPLHVAPGRRLSPCCLFSPQLSPDFAPLVLRWYTAGIHDLTVFGLRLGDPERATIRRLQALMMNSASSSWASFAADRMRR